MTRAAFTMLSSADPAHTDEPGRIWMSLTRLKTGSDRLRRMIQGQAAETLRRAAGRRRWPDPADRMRRCGVETRRVTVGRSVTPQAPPFATLDFRQRMSRRVSCSSHGRPRHA
jgi:hypothetical protein